MVVKVKILFFDERKKERKESCSFFFLLLTEEIFRGAVSGLSLQQQTNKQQTNTQKTTFSCISSPLLVYI